MIEGFVFMNMEGSVIRLLIMRWPFSSGAFQRSQRVGSLSPPSLRFPEAKLARATSREQGTREQHPHERASDLARPCECRCTGLATAAPFFLLGISFDVKVSGLWKRFASWPAEAAAHSWGELGGVAMRADGNRQAKQGQGAAGVSSGGD